MLSRHKAGRRRRARREHGQRMACAVRQNISKRLAVGGAAQRPLLNFEWPRGFIVNIRIRNSITRPAGGNKRTSGKTYKAGMKLPVSSIMISRVITGMKKSARRHGSHSACRRGRCWHLWDVGLGGHRCRKELRTKGQRPGTGGWQRRSSPEAQHVCSSQFSIIVSFRQH